jgi:hypothetical protein
MKNYDPEIEYALRINHTNAGRKFIMKEQGGGGSTIDNGNSFVTINYELKPMIFERSYNYSAL